jgi:hypothetical protein
MGEIEKEFTPEQIAAFDKIIKETTAPVPGIGTSVVQFSNIGTLFADFAAYYNRTGNVPTPAQIGVDNSVKQIDGLTNYAWVCREGMKLTRDAMANIAASGKPVRGEYKGKSGTWNNFGEFTQDGETNPNEVKEGK